MERAEIVILCGGRGIRMGKATEEVQKCLLDFDGRPILDHVLEIVEHDFWRAKVILAVGYRDDQIKKRYGSKYQSLSLVYTSSSKEGTKEALLSAGNHISGNRFFLTDGDIILRKNELYRLMEESCLGTVFCCQDDVTAPTHPLMRVGNGMVKGIWYTGGKIHEESCWRWMSTGYWSKEFLQCCKKSKTKTICGIAGENTQRKIKAVDYQGKWWHFAEPEDWLK